LLQDELHYDERPIPDERRQCSGEELFDWLAESLLGFAAEQGWYGTAASVQQHTHAQDHVNGARIARAA
jgi:hypothetical protein